MNEKREIQDEIRAITHGLPELPEYTPPENYFDQLPDEILNRWKKEASQPKIKVITWKQVIAIAAILTGVCIGLFFINQKDHVPMPITSAEAYEYVRENIDEFEGLLEYGDQVPHDAPWDVSADAIHEYLMEESSDEIIEDLF